MKSLASAVVLTLALPAFAGDWCGSWTLLSTGAPGNRLDAKIAFDSARGELVLYGGVIRSGGQDIYMGDTWIWNGSSWSQRATTGPGGRAFHGMAYDEARQRVVVHGGWVGSRATSTWTWDGATWTEHAVPGPGERGYLPLVYDSVRQRVILFGGINKSHTVVYGDTWEWDGSSWSLVDPGTGAPARAGHTSFFDPVRNMTIVLGGGNVNTFGDGWGWNGALWTPLNTSNGPSPRGTAAGAFFPTVQASVVFGGWFPNDFVTDTTWIWDGSSWEQLTAPGPAPSAYDSMTYDPIGKRLLLLRGNELWGLQLARRVVAFEAQPRPASKYPAETAEFTIGTLPGGTTVRWTKNGLPLTSSPRVQGVSEPTLRISPIQASDSGVYRAVVTTPCATSAASRGATLTVVCPADLDGNRQVDDADFVIFVAAYNEFATDRADFNADSFTDDLDFFVFASAYNDLLCP